MLLQNGFLPFIYLLIILAQEPSCEARTDDIDYEINSIGGVVPRGMYPHLVDLAQHAIVTTNATCGQRSAETYCRPNDRSGEQCDTCHSRASDRNRRHPIDRVTDGSGSTWWQSPSLAEGEDLHYVTITFDLRQVYQVAYIIVKSAISPRPGNWILERSLNGRDYSPWQYFATSDAECLRVYGIPATPGRPRYTQDTEVICTSYFSRLTPVEGGEIHTSLINGRPGAGELSEELRQFTEARFIRFRLQKIQSAEGELEVRSRYRERSGGRRFFYSIKEISVRGRCVCNGHADVCSIENGRQKCECGHNTCGDQCERCCPLFNQVPWSRGNFSHANACHRCQCHGHSSHCHFDQDIANKALSINTRGDYSGGGSCLNCQHNTEGVNCDRCRAGYFRPQGVPPNAEFPCQPCNCRGVGVTGECVIDDTQFNLGILPGACICSQGYEGPRCDRCAAGYRNYPACEACPCNRAGTVNDACEGNCQCKPNVVGERCDVCSEGMFSLDQYNPMGCTECFCNGVTDVCEAAKLPIYTIVEHGNWQVSDLRERRKIAAAQEGTDAKVAHDDMAQFSSYYFVAPNAYRGKWHTAYGQNLTVRVSWVKLRGDTSGWAYHGPDVILRGAGYRIAYGVTSHPDSTSAVLDVPLYEHAWYHFPMDIGDIAHNMDVSDYQLHSVSRAEMMQVLSNLESMMIRARYHTVQVESILHDVVLEYGKEGGATTKLVTGAVERCVCPIGYEGLSCESCSPGYRRINNTIVGGVCEKCNCHGHAESCDPFTGVCLECQHFTTGPYCDRCLPGYYGDPASGEPCMPCSCPLPIGANHFMPACSNEGITVGSRERFVCDCPVGYEGLQCERCADGFFGSPLTPGNFCQPCDCSGNVSPIERGVCDPVSGQCLKCLGNTAGWRCERCLENHFGDPSRGQCIPCGCIRPGSLSDSCDEQTGQCECRPLFVGRQCHRCQDGHGDVEAGCPPCRCSNRGSFSKLCDPVTGQCDCKPGVGGKMCNNCLKDHYGNLSDGCIECACNPIGSIGTSCVAITGQCHCRPNVEGRDCSHCAPFHWGFNSGNGCRPCDCDGRGSDGGRCDQDTGRCLCTPGVGGERCDRCLPGFWGFSAEGCKPCEPCGIAGHSCDPNSGRCICPHNTEGDRCERCRPGSWDYSNTRGCRLCECFLQGSVNSQCDFRTGHCNCKAGYTGPKCDQCSQGYYGAPNCRPCDCNTDGTRQDACDARGRCQCDAAGQCPCKTNVRGRQCRNCARGTFGLSGTNPAGCTPCYCFRRTNSCQQAPYTWSQIRQPSIRRLNVVYSFSSSDPPPAATVVVRPWNTNQICYINLAMPGERHLSTDRTRAESHLNVTNQLHVIPDSPGHIILGTAIPFPVPLYWKLPKEFMRDKIHSYNGYLKFRVESVGGTRVFPDNTLQTYPLVSLQGNWQLVLEHFPQTIQPDGTYNVRLHESQWRQKGSSTPVSREVMMIALQNIQHILIRATHSEDVVTATLSDVSLDVATEGTLVSSRRAQGVEQCLCPKGYEGLSCQNPGDGYFRWYKDNYIQSTIIIDLVGESRPCDCNGRSETCIQETGVCQNCRDNTAGDHCELCASGYYGNPVRGQCRPCACPSLTQNFAKTCQGHSNSDYICHCMEGYTGDKCDRCAFGYYGRPREPGGRCVPCGCDPHGSLHQGCDVDGRCSCKPGIIGRDCKHCAPRHVLEDTGCRSCEDGCVDVLLDEVEALVREIEAIIHTDHNISAPWPALNEIKNQYNILKVQVTHYRNNEDKLNDLLFNTNLGLAVEQLLLRARALLTKARDNSQPAATTLREAQSLMDLLRLANQKITDAISFLSNYGFGEAQSISVATALEEARDLFRRIKNRDDFDSMKRTAEIELGKAQALLERMLAMQVDRINLVEVSGRYDRMADNIREMMDIISVANTRIERAEIINNGIRSKRDHLRSVIVETEEHNGNVRDLNFDSNTLLREAQRNLEYIGENFDRLEERLLELRNYSSLLAEHEGTLYRLNNEYRDTYVREAKDHALHLDAKGIQLERLLNQIRLDTVDHLRAAQAYINILNNITAAEEAARRASDAANKAYQVAYPADVELSLIRQARRSRDHSRELENKGKDLLRQVDSLEDELRRQQQLLASAGQVLSRTSSQLTRINTDMDTQFNVDLNEDIRLLLGRTQDMNVGLDRTTSRVNEIHSNLTRILQFASHDSSFDTSLFASIREKISEAETSTMDGERLSSTLHNKVDRINAKSLDLSQRIRALKQKIEQTRQHASSIRVSVRPDESQTCVRRYSPSLQSSTTNTLVLSYAIDRPEVRNALILYMGNDNGNEFVAVEMKNRKIQVTWDIGGGPKTIEHSTILQTNTPTVSDDTKWYHIEFNRVGHIGELLVRAANTDGISPFDRYPEPVTAASQPSYTSINLRTDTSSVWIGGAPEAALERLSTRRFAGCLHYVTLNGGNLGLWNFTSNTGCAACNEGVELISRQEDEIAFGFSGKGYFKSSSERSRRRDYYSVVFAFKTLDEDALLFLATNEAKNQLLSITLERGYVVLRVQFDGQTEVVLRSDKKLNNIADMTQIDATVAVGAPDGKRYCKLAVEDQHLLGAVDIGRSPDLDLQDESYYFGGIDPQFNKSRWGDKIVLRSMLGCMAGLQVLDEGRNPFTDGQFYGIESACSEKPLTEVGFLGGDGFIELPSQELRRDSNFGFTFQTMEADALLMLSTFIGQPLPRGRTEHPPDFYSASLVEGYLELRIRSGNESERLVSTQTFNDGKPHSFFVLKQRRNVELMVDDAKIDNTRMPRGSAVVLGPRRGGLYFGGVPGLEVNEMVGSTVPFKGCIRNVIVNNQVVSFTRPVRFQAAYIGRCADLPANAMGGMERDVTEPLACQPPIQHTLEYGALKFGDQLDSYALMPLPKDIFSTTFNFTFEFRTYYPNGVFLYAEDTNPRGPHSTRHPNRRSRLALTLHNGRLVITLQNRRKPNPIIENSDMVALNNGQWRKITVSKNRRHVSFSIDNHDAQTFPAPRRVTKATHMYVGGISRVIQEPSHEMFPDMRPLDPLRGCLRNLHLNGEKIDIPQHTPRENIVGVGQCFSKIQTGSYFPGDAFAVYSNEFSVGPLLEFGLEFRTWELNGILMSVADPIAGTSLALELVNGAVILNVTVKQGHSFGARKSFRHRHRLCDNAWHSIRAQFIKDSLTLRVDSEPEAYGFNGGIEGSLAWVEAPLYIGGLPDYAPQGSLKNRDNFKGCIRNIVIDSARTDWTDMYRLHNVLLNACPVQ